MAGPTLWRTCRAVANRHRLEILAYLFEHPWSSVSDLSMQLHLSLPAMSQYLRALNARGLVEAMRKGRNVFYGVYPDPDVPGSDALVTALRTSLHSEAARDAVFETLTAFTHPRRVRIVEVLCRDGLLTFDGLRAATGISKPALNRHLGKLLRRGMIREDGVGYRCARPRSVLARVLVNLARPKQ